MVTLLWLIGLLLCITVLAHMRSGLLNGCIATAAYLLVMTILSPAHWLLMLVLWVVFLGIAIPLNLPDWRRANISTPTFHWFKKVLPPISDTEQEALEAGTVWWDGELFSGRPNWNRLHAFPRPTLTEEEKAFIDGPVEQLCAMTSDWEVTTAFQDLPPDVW